MTAEPTQNERVLDHLHRYGEIDQGQTLRWSPPITRLAARIADLQEAGNPIENVGKAGKFARYALVDPRKPDAPPRPRATPCPRCGVALEAITDTVSPGYVRGRCLAHGWQVTKR